ncbi:hypothetical protein QCF01_16305 [Staphylococcus aureus]|nr:hypothetical protein [Staphylococcus aureus]
MKSSRLTVDSTEAHFRGLTEGQPTSGRLYQGGSIEQQRQRARRTAMWVGAIAVLVYVGFILSGVIGR